MNCEACGAGERFIWGNRCASCGHNQEKPPEPIGFEAGAL